MKKRLTVAFDGFSLTDIEMIEKCYNIAIIVSLALLKSSCRNPWVYFRFFYWLLLSEVSSIKLSKRVSCENCGVRKTKTKSVGTPNCPKQINLLNIHLDELSSLLFRLASSNNCWIEILQVFLTTMWQYWTVRFYQTVEVFWGYVEIKHCKSTMVVLVIIVIHIQCLDSDSLTKSDPIWTASKVCGTFVVFSWFNFGNLFCYAYVNRIACNFVRHSRQLWQFPYFKTKCGVWRIWL